MIYNWKTPINEVKLKKFYQYLNIEDSIYLNIDKKSTYKENDCHNNVNKYILKNGGEKILGYYIVEYDNNFLAIQHSVIYTNKIIDITPDSLYNKKLFVYGYKMPEYKYIHYKDGDIIDKKKTLVNNIDGYLL